jgi:hypothetical protein
MVIILELMLIQIITTGPAEDKEAEETKQEQKARLGRLIALYVGRIVYLGTGLMLRMGVHVHE